MISFWSHSPPLPAFQIRPYVGCLVQYLPLLWKQSEEHNMLRCAILTTLLHLVQVGLQCLIVASVINSANACIQRIMITLCLFKSVMV